MASIDRLLSADGLLFIGHADRLDFRRKGEIHRDWRPRTIRLLPYLPCRPPLSAFPFKPPLPMELINWRVTAAQAAAAHLPHSDPISTQPVRQDAAVVGSRQLIEPPLLDRAAELANRGRFAEAIATCEQHLRSQGLSSSAYYLMGMICQAAGNRRRAEDSFHKAVYLDPLHDEALLALALLAERRGDHTVAAGFRRRAERSVIASRKRVK